MSAAPAFGVGSPAPVDVGRRQDQLAVQGRGVRAVRRDPLAPQGVCLSFAALGRTAQQALPKLVLLVAPLGLRLHRPEPRGRTRVGRGTARREEREEHSEEKAGRPSHHRSRSAPHRFLPEIAIAAPARIRLPIPGYGVVNPRYPKNPPASSTTGLVTKITLRAIAPMTQRITQSYSSYTGKHSRTAPCLHREKQRKPSSGAENQPPA